MGKAELIIEANLPTFESLHKRGAKLPEMIRGIAPKTTRLTVPKGPWSHIASWGGGTPGLIQIRLEKESELSKLFGQFRNAGVSAGCRRCSCRCRCRGRS